MSGGDGLELHRAAHASVSQGILQALHGGGIAVLKAHTEISVLHVVGHTDSSGDDAHNMDLSERRAASVVAMLRDKGVVQTIDAKGAGETQPVCEEDTPECHERNRRVEFIIEKNDG